MAGTQLIWLLDRLAESTAEGRSRAKPQRQQMTDSRQYTTWRVPAGRALLACYLFSFEQQAHRAA